VVELSRKTVPNKQCLGICIQNDRNRRLVADRALILQSFGNIMHHMDGTKYIRRDSGRSITEHGGFIDESLAIAKQDA
jgi:hypothetical protein